MNILDHRSVIRIAKIEDTRTWWQRSALSQISLVPVLIFTVWGAAVGALLGALQ